MANGRRFSPAFGSKMVAVILIVLVIALALLAALMAWHMAWARMSEAAAELPRPAPTSPAQPFAAGAFASGGHDIGTAEAIFGDIVDLNALLAALRLPLAEILGDRVRVMPRRLDLLGAVLVDGPALTAALLALAEAYARIVPAPGRLIIASGVAHSNEQEPAAPEACLMLTAKGLDLSELPGQGDAFAGFAPLRAVAQRHGGALRLTGRRGGGFAAILLLQAGVAPDRPPMGMNALRPPINVLLVDDDRNVREVAADMLRQGGYRVMTAVDGVQGLSVLRQHADLHLLIADFAMPGMNGLVLIRAARQLRPGLATMLITAYADISPMALGELGPLGLLHKPFTSARLLEHVAAIGPQPPAVAGVSLGVPPLASADRGETAMTEGGTGWG